MPCPHRAWATLVYPRPAGGRGVRAALARARAHAAARRARPGRGLGRAHGGAAALGRARSPARRFDAIELRGPGTELTVGLLPDAHLVGRRLHDAPTGCATCRTCRPRRCSRRRTRSGRRATSPRRSRSCCSDGTIVRGLRMRFEGGRAVEIDADENGDALRAQLAIDEGARAARRARARRPPGPHRPARHGLLRHAARRERRQPHRARLRLPVRRRGATTSRASTRAGSTSTS